MNSSAIKNGIRTIFENKGVMVDRIVFSGLVSKTNDRTFIKKIEISVVDSNDMTIREFKCIIDSYFESLGIDYLCIALDI